MSADDVTNSTVVTVSVGLVLEVEFYVVNSMLQTVKRPSAVILNGSTFGTLLIQSHQWARTNCCIIMN